MFPSCTQHERNTTVIQVIPKPLLIEPGEDVFRFNSGTKIMILGEDPPVEAVGIYLAEWFGKRTERITENSDRGKRMKDEGFLMKNGVVVGLDEGLESLGEEGYDLLVTRKGIVIKAFRPSGLFYGVQTLLQLMPPEVFGDEPFTGNELTIPAVYITDKPRYSWRGMHLDVSRHFFPVEFVKQYIDLLAMHKMNVFHWHLTDDNGWRIEIKKYPLLTEIGAWRVDWEDKPWGERPAPAEGEKATYGGFYTQDEIREVVEYARQRHILVVPEIEMPGHTSEVFAAYPQFSCRGERLFVRPGSYWPNNDIFCAGNDSVFTFLEDVLTEVMALFPSPYIHIGGDEADKTQWKACPKCQQRIIGEQLNDENELQSYFVKRIESFLNANGRRLIGWDEILEGGLAPEATVMSWRGFEGGIEAATQGHDVIMCPVSHCYFDYYQGDPEFQPLGIGGFTTLKKVYSFEPTPPVLTEEQARFVLGGQGNVWAEFIATPQHAEYMALPRMTALAEVLWSAKESRNWEDFSGRLQDQFQRFDRMKVNYSRGSYAVEVHTFTDTVAGKIMVNLTSEQYKPKIRYTLDGMVPDTGSAMYTGPLILDSTTLVKAAIFVADSMMEKPVEKQVILHKATGKPVSYSILWNYKYPGQGAGMLTDGIRGSDRHNDGCWQGFHGDDLEVEIDLGAVQPIGQVSAGFLQRNRSWIFFPVNIVVEVSQDKSSWKTFTSKNDVNPTVQEAMIKELGVNTMDVQGRYVRVKAVNLGECPPGHPGAGDQAWIFTDEIIVN
jgi:hexosaminidase